MLAFPLSNCQVLLKFFIFESQQAHKPPLFPLSGYLPKRHRSCTLTWQSILRCTGSATDRLPNKFLKRSNQDHAKTSCGYSSPELKLTAMPRRLPPAGKRVHYAVAHAWLKCGHDWLPLLSHVPFYGGHVLTHVLLRIAHQGGMIRHLQFLKEASVP